MLVSSTHLHPGWEVWRTVALNLTVDAFDHAAQVGPFGEVLEVEADAVRFGERIEIGRRDAQQVGRAHRADGRHVGSSPGLGAVQVALV